MQVCFFGRRELLISDYKSLKCSFSSYLTFIELFMMAEIDFATCHFLIYKEKYLRS